MATQLQGRLALPEFSRVEKVILDGVVLLKIIKHSRENVHATVTGKLLGLEWDGKVEVWFIKLIKIYFLQIFWNIYF